MQCKKKYDMFLRVRSTLHIPHTLKWDFTESQIYFQDPFATTRGVFVDTSTHTMYSIGTIDGDRKELNESEFIFTTFCFADRYMYSLLTTRIILHGTRITKMMRNFCTLNTWMPLMKTRSSTKEKTTTTASNTYVIKKNNIALIMWRDTYVKIKINIALIVWGVTYVKIK